MKRRDLFHTPLALRLPSIAPAQQPASDIGNLYDFLRWTSEKQRLGLSFLDARWNSLEEWKATARPHHNRLLAYEPPAVPLSAELLGREQRDGFTLEKLRIRATEAYDIPAWLLLPANRTLQILWCNNRF